MIKNISGAIGFVLFMLAGASIDNSNIYSVIVCLVLSIVLLYFGGAFEGNKK